MLDYTQLRNYARLDENERKKTGMPKSIATVVAPLGRLNTASPSVRNTAVSNAIAIEFGGSARRHRVNSITHVVEVDLMLEQEPSPEALVALNARLGIALRGKTPTSYVESSTRIYMPSFYV